MPHSVVIKLQWANNVHEAFHLMSYKTGTYTVKGFESIGLPPVATLLPLPLHKLISR